jgi:hypothetical protein
MKKVTPAQLHDMLCKGTVKFQYTKKDGTVREALGTLNPKMVTVKPAGGRNIAKEAGYTTYFDVEKSGWRCFHDSKLLGVVES